MRRACLRSLNWEGGGWVGGVEQKESRSCSLTFQKMCLSSTSPDRSLSPKPQVSPSPHPTFAGEFFLCSTAALGGPRSGSPCQLFLDVFLVIQLVFGLGWPVQRKFLLMGFLFSQLSYTRFCGIDVSMSSPNPLEAHTTVFPEFLWL